MTEAVIFQFCGTLSNAHLEAHPGALTPEQIYHSLVSSEIPRPTYKHSAGSDKKLGSLSCARPVGPGEFQLQDVHQLVPKILLL